MIHNESRELVVLLHDQFRAHAEHPEVDLFPTPLRAELEAFYDQVYEPLLNGVYRAGFALTQAVHDAAVADVFAALDGLERRLAKQRWVMGDRFSFADVVLFPTLWRFDFVYAIHFKCSRRRIRDYPALSAYVREVYSWPTTRASNVAELTRRHYYRSHYTINPQRIVAKVDLSWMDAAHGREGLAQREAHWFMTSA